MHPLPTPPHKSLPPPSTTSEGGDDMDFKPIRIALESPTDGLETLFTYKRGFDAIIVKPGDELPEVDMVCFSGGADIDPKLYKQKKLPKTFPSPYRDEFSFKLHKKYALLPKVGVCRGAQFLCAINGGSLWQHIGSSHNNGQHYITTADSLQRNIMVTSVHHQACRPTKHMEMLAYSANKASTVEDDKVVDTTGVSIAEAFFIPEDNALCVQFHPEYGMKSCEEYFWEIFWIKFPQLLEVSLQTKKVG